jgi:hypothetical protein
MTMAGHMGAVNSLCVFYASQSHPHCILSGSADQTIKVRFITMIFSTIITSPLAFLLSILCIRCSPRRA